MTTTKIGPARRRKRVIATMEPDSSADGTQLGTVQNLQIEMDLAKVGVHAGA
jgi:hypothetical protein